MILVTTATEIEMVPFLKKLGYHKESKVANTDYETLITGVGPAATASALAKKLSENGDTVQWVLNFGVAGAYIQPAHGSQPQLLDICIAEKEVFGDIGVCLGDEIEYLDPGLTGDLVIHLNRELLRRSVAALEASGFKTYSGNFITVSSTTGRRKRADYLQSTWNGLCENMEGAASARVCDDFKVPFVEVRCISNYVVDRDTSTWNLAGACEKAADAAVLLLNEIKGYD